MPTKIPCFLEKTHAGWYLTFPSDAKAGLILDDTELENFLESCEAHDTSTPLFFFATSNCPIAWYEKASTFKTCPF
jgi:hypothetical protein